MRLYLLLLVGCIAWSALAVSDRSQWVEPNELKSTPRNAKKTATNKSGKKAAAKVKEDLMLQEDLLDEASVDELRDMLEMQHDQLMRELSAKLSPVQRMVARLLADLNTAGSTFHKKTGDKKNYEEHYRAKWRLDYDEYKVLKRFADNSEPSVGQVQDAMQQLNQMLVDLEQENSEEELSLLEQLLTGQVNPQYLLMGNVALLLLLASILAYHVIQLDKWQFFWRLVLIVFLASIVWTWVHMYKEKQAEMHARWAKRDIPTSCIQKAEVSASEALWNYVTSIGQLPQIDGCVEYHKDLLVDPIWEVPPTMALSRTLTAFLLEPMQHIARHLSLFIQHLFKDLPFQYFPLAIGFTILLILVPLFCYMGYCVRLPLGVYIGPSAAPPPVPIAPLQPAQPYLPPPSSSPKKLTSTKSVDRRSRSSAKPSKSHSTPIKLYLEDSAAKNGPRKYVKLQQELSSDNCEGDDNGGHESEHSRSRSMSVGRS